MHRREVVNDVFKDSVLPSGTRQNDFSLLEPRAALSRKLAKSGSKQDRQPERKIRTGEGALGCAMDNIGRMLAENPCERVKVGAQGDAGHSGAQQDVASPTNEYFRSHMQKR